LPSSPIDSARVIAGLRSEMEVLAAEATAALQSDADGINNARFDCDACHLGLFWPSARPAAATTADWAEPPSIVPPAGS
jgi:hypothetical protein